MQSYCYAATYEGAGNPLTTSDPYGGTETLRHDALNRLQNVTGPWAAAPSTPKRKRTTRSGALKTTFDPIAMSAVTLDDQRPNLSGSGTADAAVVKTFGGQPVTLDGGGRITSLSGVTFSHNFRNRVMGTSYASGRHRWRPVPSETPALPQTSFHPWRRQAVS
jgi:hypothetical protein